MEVAREGEEVEGDSSRSLWRGIVEDLHRGNVSFLQLSNFLLQAKIINMALRSYTDSV